MNRNKHLCVSVTPQIGVWGFFFVLFVFLFCFLFCFKTVVFDLPSEKGPYIPIKY